MKLNSKTFYKNHLNEINRYFDDSDLILHIINENSDVPKIDNQCDILKINTDDKTDIKTLRTEKKYKLVIVTDLFELSDDIYLFLQNLSESLDSNGKLLITSINPKWNSLLKFFETLKLKNLQKKGIIFIQKKLITLLNQPVLNLFTKIQGKSFHSQSLDLELLSIKL